jgi:hypothetical protein
MQYKCVPAPKGFEIDKNGSSDNAVRSFADLLNRESNDGWKFHSMESISVTQNPGCLAGLFGKRAETTNFYMLIFSKE